MDLAVGLNLRRQSIGWEPMNPQPPITEAEPKGGTSIPTIVREFELER